MKSKLIRASKDIYHSLRGFSEKYVIGSFLQKMAWRLRHFRQGTTWIETHWSREKDSWAQKQVNYFGTVLERYFLPFNTCLDYGCLTGVNCHLLSKQFPTVQWYGIDVSEAAINYGKEKIATLRNKRVELSPASGEGLSAFKAKSIDVIFTSAVLFYLAPKTAARVINEMLRVARKGVVFFELQSPHNSKDPHGMGIYDGGRWMRNYKDALTALGVRPENVIEEKIPPEFWGGHPEKAFCTIARIA